MAPVITTPVATTTPRRPARRGRARGFTILECALAMVILAVGVLALIEAQGYFYTANQFSSRSATGAYLAGEMRERMRLLPKHDPVTGLFKDGILLGWGPESGEAGFDDYDDVDDFDGIEFGEGAARPGPIDSVGRVITQTDVNGVVEISTEGVDVSLRGWKQRVIVDKVEPTNYATVRPDDYENLGSTPVTAVNKYALRVTVIVTYLAPGETAPAEMARLVWIAP